MMGGSPYWTGIDVSLTCVFFVVSLATFGLNIWRIKHLSTKKLTLTTVTHFEYLVLDVKTERSYVSKQDETGGTTTSDPAV